MHSENYARQWPPEPLQASWLFELTFSTTRHPFWELYCKNEKSKTIAKCNINLRFQILYAKWSEFLDRLESAFLTSPSIFHCREFHSESFGFPYCSESIPRNKAPRPSPPFPGPSQSSYSISVRAELPPPQNNPGVWGAFFQWRSNTRRSFVVKNAYMGFSTRWNPACCI